MTTKQLTSTNQLMTESLEYNYFDQSPYWLLFISDESGIWPTRVIKKRPDKSMPRNYKLIPKGSSP